MNQELRRVTINMKSLDQHIDNPIIAGGGDAQGRHLRIIFTQEAAAQITPDTKIYLSWRHLEKNVRGLNVFKHISTKPQTWEISYPSEMILEGNVACCIQLIDKISITQSANFTVHVLADIDDGSNFIPSDNYSEFQKAKIDMSNLAEEMSKELEAWKEEHAGYTSDLTEIRETANSASETAQNAFLQVQELGSTVNIVKEDAIYAKQRLAGIEEPTVKQFVENKIAESCALYEF